jgi:hypothetical protein
MTIISISHHFDTIQAQFNVTIVPQIKFGQKQIEVLKIQLCGQCVLQYKHIQKEAALEALLVTT